MFAFVSTSSQNLTILSFILAKGKRYVTFWGNYTREVSYLRTPRTAEEGLMGRNGKLEDELKALSTEQ